MRSARLRRAAMAAVMASLLAVPAVSAETVTADGDTVTPGIQGTVDLGSAAPGADVPVDLSFVVECSGTSHLDPGQGIRLTPGSRTVPLGGTYSVGSTTITPGAGWPADGAACPSDLAPVVGSLHIVLTTPPDPATDQQWTFSWNRAVTPAGSDDGSVLEGSAPSVTFILDVAAPTDNTPPTLVLPPDSTIEGDTAGGALAAYDVSATDTEDATAPTPVCSPAVGDYPAAGSEHDLLLGHGRWRPHDGRHVPDHGRRHRRSGPRGHARGPVAHDHRSRRRAAQLHAPDRHRCRGSSPHGGLRAGAGQPRPGGRFDGHVHRDGRQRELLDGIVQRPRRARASELLVGGGVGRAHRVGRIDPGSRPADDPREGVDLAGRGSPRRGRRLADRGAVRGRSGGRRGGGAAGARRTRPATAPATEPVSLHLQHNGRWMGHLDTAGLAPGCWTATLLVDGAPAGQFSLLVEDASNGARANCRRTTRTQARQARRPLGSREARGEGPEGLTPRPFPGRP